MKPFCTKQSHFTRNNSGRRALMRVSSHTLANVLGQSSPEHHCRQRLLLHAHNNSHANHCILFSEMYNTDHHAVIPEQLHLSIKRESSWARSRSIPTPLSLLVHVYSVNFKQRQLLCFWQTVIVLFHQLHIETWKLYATKRLIINITTCWTERECSTLWQTYTCYMHVTHRQKTC